MARPDWAKFVWRVEAPFCLAIYKVKIMAKVFIVLEDQEDGVSVGLQSEPELPMDLDEDAIDNLTEAQLLALNILEWLEEEEEFEEEDD